MATEMLERVSVAPEGSVAQPEGVVAAARPRPYRRAGNEVWRILDAIGQEMGLATAVLAAGALRSAAVEGRIAGDNYVISLGQTPKDCIACAVGTLAIACGFREYCAPRLLPHWGRGYARRRDLTPLEQWVRWTHQGDTPQNSEELRVLVGWLDQWAAKTGVTID